MWLTQYNTLPLLFYVHFAKSGYEFILCKLKATDKNSRLVIQSINVKLLNYKTKGFNNLWLCDMIHQMQQFSLINDIYACITKEWQSYRLPCNVVWIYNQSVRSKLSEIWKVCKQVRNTFLLPENAMKLNVAIKIKKNF